MTYKAKSKSTTAVASPLKSKNVSLPQLSTINAATLSVLHLHCMLLFSICHNIWCHLKGKSSPFADVSALANFAFPAMKTPLVSLNEYCGQFWFPQAFMSLLISEEDALGDEDVVEVKASKHSVHTTKPPACVTPIVKVLAHSSGSSKTKQKSSNPKGKKHAIDPPSDEGEKDEDGDMDLDKLNPSQPSATKSIQDLNLEEIVGGTANTGPSALATLCAVSPSNTIDSTNKASAAVANNANPLLPSNSIAFFGLLCLLTASKSDDEDEVLHTLST
uniref:Uncharacterized protein n=1 Tax=Moniliophthora roreri TaxID=221103 RepID=A0A0W0F9L5_MONRR